MPRAFLICGPEATGTRYLASILCQAGCFGQSTHQQTLDNDIPVDKENLVWRRSLPHAHKYPNIGSMVDDLELKGYEVRLLLTMRSMDILVQSQVKNSHVKTREDARKNVMKAHRHVARFLLDRPDIVFDFVPYESILTTDGVRGLLQYLGLPDNKLPSRITDGNTKYRK